jgi:hypothetical protein
VALVTSDPDAVKDLKWDLPHQPSLQRLIRKTRGRVLFADPRNRREEGSDSVQHYLTDPERRTFQRALTRTPLYVEFKLRA